MIVADSLRDRLQKYFKTPDRFELPATNDLGSPDIDATIRAYLPSGDGGEPTLVITDCTVPEGTDRVTWKGNAVLSRGQDSPYAVSVVFEERADGKGGTIVEFVIETTSLGASWSFDRSFAELAETAVAAVRFEAPSLTLASAAPDGSGEEEAGLRFRGRPRDENVVALAGWMIPNLAALGFDGVIRLDDDRPVFHVETDPGEPYGLGPLKVRVRLALDGSWEETEYTEGPPDRDFVAYVEFRTDIGLGTGTGEPAATVSVATRLFWGDESLLTFELVPDGGATLDSYDQLDSLTDGRHSFAALIPGDVGLPVAPLEVTELSFTIDTAARRLSDITASVVLKTEEPWPLLPGGLLKVVGTGATFTVADPMGSTAVSATLFGRFEIGESFQYDVTVALPALVMTGSLAPGSEIDVSELVNFFARPLIGEVGGIETGLTVRLLDLWLAPRQNALEFAATVGNDWKLQLPLFQLELPTLAANLSYAENEFSVVFSTVMLLDGAEFDVTAAHATDAGWTFTLAMPPGSSLDLLTILKRFFAPEPWDPPYVSNGGVAENGLAIEDVFVQVNSKTGAYEVRGAAVASWDLPFVPGETLRARAHIAVRRTPGGAITLHAGRPLPLALPGAADDTQATFGGELSIGRFQAMVEYQYVAKDQTTLSFMLAFGRFSLTAVLTRQKDKVTEKEETVLTAALGDMTVGEVIESLVALVDPSLNFRLEAPWDFLNGINLKNLQLTANLTKQTVGVAYRLDQDFVLAHIDTIGLTYVPRSDGRRSVDIAITGRFLDEEYTPQNPLKWDLLNDPPPQPPGKGSKLIDVRYLGLGQNVGFRDPRSFTSVKSVIDALMKDFQPVDGDANPLDALAPLKFTGDGRWLIGADLTLMETVSLAGVFADPELYGIRIGLAGARAKSLAGLEFEILYRKVTDTIGVYQIELKLPDAVRQLEFGALSITLPIIYVEVYTNGNFRVDLGFPRGGDFSRSFGLQWFPFVGKGGFYFALLNGSTSQRVPRITNGTFSPVIEFGVGLAAGLGKAVDKGILRASATLTVQAIIEGVLGWFNPTDAAGRKDEFYWIQGQAAIVGEVFGAVDFVVVKADVHVLARAWAMLTVEAYKAAVVALEVRVEASASVKVLFIRVHFSFNVTLDLTFTVGSDRPTPWRIDPTPPRPRLRQANGRYAYRPERAAALLRALRAAAPEYEWDWTPREVFPARRPVYASVMPGFTTALPEAGATGAAEPGVQVVMALWVPNSIPAPARTAREVMQLRMAAPEEAPFNALVDGVLRWALGALERDDRTAITAAELDAIAEYLDDPARRRAVYTYDHLRTFLGLNYDVELGTPLGPTGAAAAAGIEQRWGRWSKWAGGAGVPSISDVLGEDGPVGLVGFTREPAAGGASFAMEPAAARGATGPEDSGTVFPMVPELTMAPQGLGPIDFMQYRPVGATYEALLDRLFDELRIDVDQDVAPDPARREAAGPRSPATHGADPAGATASLASVIFRDYFALIGKAGVEQAAQLLRRYPYEPGPYDTLASIAEQFDPVTFFYATRPGDTIARVAARFDTTPEALVAGNPALAGVDPAAALPRMELSIAVGVTVKSILAANQDHPFAATGVVPPRLTLDGVKYQVKNGDTLGHIAAGFGMTGPAALFTEDLGNAESTTLLRPDARLKVPQGPHFTPQADDLPKESALLRAAAFYTARTAPPPTSEEYPYLAWYTQQTVDLNRDQPEIDFADLSRSAGHTITVPVAELTQQGIRQTGTTKYTVREADTIELVGAYFELIQLEPERIRPLYDDLARLNPGAVEAGRPIVVPAFERRVRPADSLARIRALFGASYDGLLGPTAGNAANPELLNPLHVLKLPRLEHRIAPEDTPRSVAERFDLSIADLATSIAGCTGIFPPHGEPLVIPDVPKRSIDRLVDDLLRTGRFNAVSALASRFLLHGLRIPDPGDAAFLAKAAGPSGFADLVYRGLYDLVGQQFAAPTGATGDYGVRFTKAAGADWLKLASPDPNALEVLLSPAVRKENAPAPVLDPQILTGPTAAPLFLRTAPRHGLEQSVHWQAAREPQLPPSATGPTGLAAGQPSIWFLPNTLTSLIAGLTGPTGATRPYEVVEATPTDADPLAVRPLQRYAWGTAVPLRVRRAPGDAGEPMSNAYLMLGADPAGRDLLRQLWEFLEASGQPSGARLYLLYSPPGDASGPQGLASDALDAAATVLFRTNLSTVTHSGGDRFAGLELRPGAPPPAGDYFARIDSAAAFLKYLWEGSVTSSGGFYLRYANAAGGVGLPDALFANGPDATLWLVVLLDAQNGAAGRDRRLFPFTNCAVIGDNVGLGRSSLFARLEHPLPDEQVAMATAPPGTVGFRLTRINPDFGQTGMPAPEQRTRSLYSLVGYRIAENDYFRASPEGLPAGPLADEQGAAGARGALDAAPPDPRVWSYEQLVPVARFGRYNVAPACTALPPAAENPYAGITGATGPAGLGVAELALGFQDVYGNRTKSTQPLGRVRSTVGYTDPLIGPGGWPGIAAGYAFAPPDGAAPGATGAPSATLYTMLALQTDRYAPGGALDTDAALRAASADAVRYRQIYYQTLQPDVRFDLGTNLGVAAGGEAGLRRRLTGFVAGAYVYTHAASRLEPVGCTAAAGDTLAAIGAAYSVDVASLAVANQDQRARRLFASGLAVPYIRAARAGDSLASLAAIGGTASPRDLVCPLVTADEDDDVVRVDGVRLASPSAPGPRSRVQEIAGADPPALTPEDVAANNATLPLTDGITLRVPARTFRTDGLTGPAASVGALAERLHCNVYNAFASPTAQAGPTSMVALGIVGSNFGQTGILAPDLAITVGDRQVATTDESTFESLYQEFADLPLTPGEFAQAIRDVPGLVREGVEIRYEDLITGSGALGATGPVTFEALEQTFPGQRDWIASENRDVANVFESGSPVLLNASCVVPDATETIFDVAHAHDITVEQLAAQNGAAPLCEGAELAIPALLRLPDDAAELYAPHTTAPGETLGGVADRFGCDPVVLAELNAQLRDVLRPGAAIGYPGLKPVYADEHSTIESVYDAFRAQDAGLDFASYAQQVAKQDVLWEGARLIAPLPAVPEDSGTSVSLEALAARLNLHVAAPSTTPEADVGALAGANRALDGFLRTGAVLRGATGTTPPTETVGPHDTLTRVAERFAARGIPVSPVELAQLNRDVEGILSTGCRFLVPPASLAVATRVDLVVPPKGATGEAAVVFPVEVDLTMRRDPALVQPDFRDTAEVWRATTPLAPWSGDAGRLALTEFARLFERALLPFSLKLATSKALELADAKSSTVRVWAINFGASGIRDVDLLQDSPQFYAIPPISTSLAGRDDVPVSDYRSGFGLCCPKVPKSFQSVDLDAWLSEFLEAVDLVLTPPYAVPAFALAGATGANRPEPPRPATAPARGPVGLVGRDGAATPAGAAGTRRIVGAGIFGATGATAPCYPCPGATAPYGPTDYEKLVRAKQDIAEGLARRVENILEPGPAVPFYLDDAREAMRQQLLVRLGAAYAYDAIVQYPVTVDSPFTAHWPHRFGESVPPRFAGKLLGTAYVTPPGATLDTVARALDVAPAFLAAVLLDVRGVLRVGAEVAYDPGKAPFVVGRNDTVRSIAEYFGVDTTLTNEAAWAAWRDFAAYLGGKVTELFAENASLALSRARRMVVAGDSIGTFAEYFNTSVGGFGHANESRPGFFRDQARIRIDAEHTYTANDRQTLLEVIAAINTQFSLELDVATFCAIARKQRDILNPGAVMGWVQVAPDFSVSTAKLSLGAVELEGPPPRRVPPPLTFLASVKREERHRKVFLNLRYAVNEIEHGIRDVAGVEGYQASSWLTFVIPPGSADDVVKPRVATAIEQVSIPLPLRSYPTPPSVVAQSGVAAVPDADTLPEARRWDYGFTYSSNNADQDTTYLEMAFGNRRHAVAAAAGATLADRLFAPLAQFINVYPALRPDLAELPRLGKGGDPNVAAIAFQTMAELADGVADAFRSAGQADAVAAGTLPRQVYWLRADNATDLSGKYLEALHLESVGYTGPPDGALGHTGPNGGWPEVWVHTDKGFKPLKLEDWDRDSAQYGYEEPVPADAPLLQRMVFPQRDVIENEDGWAGLYVTRNEDLVSSGPLGPTAAPGMTGPVPTNPAFVYRTPLVRSVNKLTPLLVNQTRMFIEDIVPAVSGGARQLEDYLSTLFDALLDLGPTAKTTGEYAIKLACNYLYPLAEDGADAELVASTPVLLKPNYVIGRTNKAAFVDRLAGALREWVRANAIDTEVGRLQIQVTVFSAEGEPRTRARRAAPAAGATAIAQPILDIENLQLRLRDVDWTPPGPARGPRGLV
ncbi:MAG TPA: LysM peptidoglycan-binding domain-containing protein [Longimicrobiales bacterium]